MNFYINLIREHKINYLIGIFKIGLFGDETGNIQEAFKCEIVLVMEIATFHLALLMSDE